METPNYYAVIPASVRYADLAPNAKLLYGEITALASKEGFCWASDSYFAELYKVKRETVNRWISDLRELGVIRVEVQGDRDKKSRKIYIIDMGGLVIKKSQGMCEKNHKGLCEKSHISITRDTSNTINKNTDTAKQASQAKEIAHLIKLFEPINPNYDTLFGNKTERSALVRLIDKWGYEKVESMIAALPHIVSKPYAPKITTPWELEKNLAKLVLFTKQEKAIGGNTKISQIHN